MPKNSEGTLPMNARKRDYMTVKETAQYLKCCEKTVRNDLDRMRYPYRKHGRAILIDRYDVDKFLDDSTYWFNKAA